VNARGEAPPEHWRDRPLQRIAVFRALVLGDMLCALPALRALRHACPDADITLVGLPWAREFARRVPQIDGFIEFPGYPGLPEQAPELAALPGFLAHMQSQRFDLLLQMHGSGGIVNPLVAACGARHVAGFVEPGGWCAEPALHTSWPETGHEIERLLRLTDHLGMARRGLQLEFPLAPADRAGLQRLWPAMHEAPYVCVHAGAQLPSRRWPPERFAAVADRLAQQGLGIVLTGTAAEAGLAARVERAMAAPAVDLVGRTSLWTLGALVAGARLVVCNDTGVSHIAAALGTPSVVVSCGADVARWAPLERERHTVLWEPMPCRPCSHVQCPYEHGCATGITPAMVAEAARALLAETAPARALLVEDALDG
jgi:ADP-heptose:LPS heptosyltransferase